MEVFIGSINDPDSLIDCLKGVDAIISGIAQNRNEPGCNISQVSARSIVQALDTFQETEGGLWKCPKLVWISSASISPHSPPPHERDFGHRVALRAFHHIYSDIKLAISCLKSTEWLPLVIAEPGALVHHPATGVKLVEGRSSEIVPYKDFARGLIEMGVEDGWEGRHVGMVVNNEVDLDGGLMAPLLRYLIPGLLGTYSPWLCRLFERWWAA